MIIPPPTPTPIPDYVKAGWPRTLGKVITFGAPVALIVAALFYYGVFN